MSLATDGTALDRLGRHLSEPVARRLANIAGVTPNRLSACAFAVGGVLTPGLILSGRLRVAGLTQLLGDYFDYLDGDVARAQGTMSVQGDVLDGILDRYTDFFTLSSMLIHISKTSPAVLGARRAKLEPVSVVGFLALLGSMVPSYVQAVSVASGAPTILSIGGRGTRSRIVALGLLCGRPLWGLGSIAVLSNIGAVHRASHLLNELARRKAAGLQELA